MKVICFTKAALETIGLTSEFKIHDLIYKNSTYKQYLRKVTGVI